MTKFAFKTTESVLSLICPLLKVSSLNQLYFFSYLLQQKGPTKNASNDFITQCAMHKKKEKLLHGSSWNTLSYLQLLEKFNQ